MRPQRCAPGWLMGLLGLAVLAPACDPARPLVAGEGVVSSAGPALVAAEPSGGADPATAPADSPALCAARVRPGQQHGMCYAHSWGGHGGRGYGSATSEASLEELRALGIDWISVTPFGFQQSLASTEVERTHGSGGESDERVRTTIAAAHALGLHVVLKPHIWIGHGAWQGQIDPGGPDGWAQWFDSYERFIVHYAELAQSAGADMLVVGVELGSSTTAFPDRWRTLIAHVRSAYSGPLVYAANWDEADRVTFWDALDYIGVQMYAPLAEHPDDPPEVLRQHAAAQLSRFEVLSERFDRPVILTEVGYKSLRGTAVSPNVWPEALEGQPLAVDQAAQAAAYCAILETFGQADFVAGIYWWKWFTDPETDEEGPAGFAPRGKLAEDVLRAAYGGGE